VRTIQTTAPPARRAASLGVVLALAAGMLLPGTAAGAAVTTPAPGSTVGGIVPITEDRGGSGPCGTPESTIQVDRVVDGQSVVNQRRTSSGPGTHSWDSIGQPLGEYRVRSWTRDTVRSGFLNLGCTLQAAVLRSDHTFTLANQVNATVVLPSSNITGEPLAASVTVREATTNRRVSGEFPVTLAIDGVGEQDLTTDSAGAATTTFELPDLPVGGLTVTAAVTGDDRFLDGSGAGSTTLTHRTSQTFWQGATRGNPGDQVRLAAQTLDVTPGSARYGQAIPSVPVALRLENLGDTVATTGSGRVATQVTLSGASRLAPASATFGGDDVWFASKDELTFYIGDIAAQPAPEEHATVGGTTRLLGGLLGGLTKTVDTVVSGTTSLLTSTTDVLGGALQLTGPIGSSLQDVLDIVDAGLLHLLTESELQAALDLLLGEIGDGAGKLGDPVDGVLDQLLDQLAQAGPLGDVIDTVRFDWRAVYVAPDGTQQARQFGALMGVPEPLDVTGDGTPDVLANLTLTTGVVGLDLSGVDGLLGAHLNPAGGTDLVPRLEIARLSGAPADLPLSLQAVLTMPGTDEMRIGYDTRQGEAPAGFRADLILGDGGVGVQLASRGGEALALTGAIVSDAVDLGPPFERDGKGRPDFDRPVDRPETQPGDLRFAIGFDPAPRSARLALDTGSGGQDVAATFDTVEETIVQLTLIDDDGHDEVLFVNGAIDAIDGQLAVGIAGGGDGDLGVGLRGDRGLDVFDFTGQQIKDGRIQQDLLLSLTDAPDTVELALDPDGTAGLTASDAIGELQVGFASDRHIATLDDEAFLHLLDEGDTSSVAAKLPGVRSLTMGAGDNVGLDIEMASTPLRALVASDGLQLDASILDAPESLRLAMGADGAIEILGSAPIDLVTVTASDPSGLIMDATDIDLRIEDVPGLLAITMGADGVTFDAGGQPIGLLEITGTSGPEVVMPEDDGLNLVITDEEFVLAGRIHGLRNITAVLEGAPVLGLDTVAGKVFALNINLGGSEVKAVIDHLVPNMRIVMEDDGSGALGLKYSADEPTNSISFELGGLVASFADPLPAQLEICMASDESCLPDAGITDPGMGSFIVRASEYTTLNLTDPAGEMSAQNLRLRLLEMTGDLDADRGGPLYFNTTEHGDHCPSFGCIYPIPSGRLVVSLGSLGVTFTPAGFAADDATVNLRVDKFLGIPVGVTQLSQTGNVHCTPQTRLNGTMIGITLNLTDGICDRSTPIPVEEAPVIAEPAADESNTEVIAAGENGEAEASSTSSTTDASSSDAEANAGTQEVTTAEAGATGTEHASSTG
jgi:hypothetical protein